MAEHLMKDIEEDLICSICMNRFKNPKMLPCIHSFCQGCLEKYAKQLRGKEFACPTCRRVCQLPNGVMGLQTNFHFMNLGEKVDLYKKLEPSKKSTGSCGMCDQPASEQDVFCVECEFIICLKCKVQHSRIPVTSTHEVIPLAGDAMSRMKTVARKTDFPSCTRHAPEKLRFFCKTCFQLICRECTVVQHPKPDHQCVEAPAEFQNVKRVLHQLLKQSESQMRQTAQYMSTGKAGKLKVDQEFNTLRKTIGARYEEFRAAIENQIKVQMEQAKADAASTHATKVATIESSIQHAESWVESMKCTQEVVAKVIKEDNLCELLGMSNELISSFNDLRSDLDGFEWEKSDLDLQVIFSPEEVPTVEFGACVGTSEADMPAVAYGRGGQSSHFFVCELDKAEPALNIAKFTVNDPMEAENFSVTFTKFDTDNFRMSLDFDYNYQRLIAGLNEWLLVMNCNAPNATPSVFRIREFAGAPIVCMCVIQKQSQVALVFDDDLHSLYFCTGMYSSVGGSWRRSVGAPPLGPRVYTSELNLESSVEAFKGQLKQYTSSHKIKAIVSVTNTNVLLCATVSDIDKVVVLGQSPHSPVTLVEADYDVQKPSNVPDVKMLSVLCGYSDGSDYGRKKRKNPRARHPQTRNEYQCRIECVILWHLKSPSSPKGSSYIITVYDTMETKNTKMWSVPPESGRPRACDYNGSGKPLRICDISGKVFMCTQLA